VHDDGSKVISIAVDGATFIGETGRAALISSPPDFFTGRTIRPEKIKNPSTTASS